MGKNKGDGGAGNAMQTALKNQTASNNKLGENAQFLMNQNNKYYSSSAPASSQLINSNLNATAPGYTSGLQGLLNSGGDRSGVTGINANKLGQDFVGYASNPNQTNLSKANPALTGYYGDMLKNGLDKTFVNSQYGQIDRGVQTGINNAKATARPGQNMNTLFQDLFNQGIMAKANLGGQLAGANQQAKTQGAQGLAETSVNQDNQILTMLSQALSQGQGVNNQSLQNLLYALQQGQTQLGNAMDSQKLGIDALGGANSIFQNLSAQQGQQAQQFGQQAAAARQNSGGLLGGILGTVGNIATGGLLGGVSSVLKGIGGGGGGGGAPSLLDFTGANSSGYSTNGGVFGGN